MTAHHSNIGVRQRLAVELGPLNLGGQGHDILPRNKCVVSKQLDGPKPTEMV